MAIMVTELGFTKTQRALHVDFATLVSSLQEYGAGLGLTVDISNATREQAVNTAGGLFVRREAGRRDMPVLPAIIRQVGAMATLGGRDSIIWH